MRKMSKIKEKALGAAEKKALYGPDLDLSSFKGKAEKHVYKESLAGVSEEEKQGMAEAGMILTGEKRTGSYIQMDHSPVHCSVREEGVEILPTMEALKKYDGLPDYWWKAVDVGADKYTARAELDFHNGYFIQAGKGVKSLFPVQACLYLSEEGISQNVHNIVIVEEDAELHIITGCTTAPHLERALHIGVSEFYVKRGATLTFTMIHNWGEEVAVRPRTAVWVDEGGTYLSNYVCMKPARSLQMAPSVRLMGGGAVTRLNTILVARKGSEMDVGGSVHLEATGTRAEIISRTISTGGNIIARGLLVGYQPGVKAHLECNGLMLAESGNIRAIPELDGRVAGVEMSHEAAVGRISQEEIEYLMARGISEAEATALIVRGFLNIEMEGLPAELKQEIDRVIAESGKSLM
jgi:Fe-S cluster assembly scaffold protein SufB